MPPMIAVGQLDIDSRNFCSCEGASRDWWSGPTTGCHCDPLSGEALAPAQACVRGDLSVRGGGSTFRGTSMINFKRRPSFRILLLSRSYRVYGQNASFRLL